MDNMDERVNRLHQWYLGKKYDEIIEYGMSILNQPMDDLCRVNVYQHLASAFYAKRAIPEFVEWQIKAVEYIPDSMWQEKLKLWGDAAFASHYLSDITDQELADCHMQAQKIVEHIPWIYTEAEKQRLKKRLKAGVHGKKIKIAYISADFVNSVNITYVIQLLGAYDRKSFEVYCYALNDHEDSVTQQLKEFVNGWQDVHAYSAEDIARQIYNDGIDILVDISLYTGGARSLAVVAYKPAPIIVGGIGYMSTSGLKAMDYFLTDVYCDSEGMGDNHFTEKLIRLPYTHFCYTPHEHSQKYKVNTAVHTNITFGSMNNFYKLNDDVLMAWLRIMDRVPDSKLIMQSTGTELVAKIMKQRLMSLGFDMTRVELRPASTEYMATYQDIDILLDSYPYTGGGTTFDSLYMGVPVISLYGTRHGNRFGYSILKNLGLEELAVNSWQEYEERAVMLAQNPDVVQVLHEGLRTMLQRSPLMDAKMYVRAVEKEYKLIWNKFMH
ncbi:MAG: UDP-N-acetylglucosamine-peptide N-acetylglucosaminyltransferase [Selenomonadales bacterium]|nr:UDP-N-acetylglucosamine-peptide N-acetylglucosaminyltransferase [Selenomonadales bacterium]